MESTERKYFDMEIEPLLNTPRMREIQWEKLQRTIRYHYEKVPFDRKRMERAGVRPEDIRSFDDFAKSIPCAGQADYRALTDVVGTDMDLLFSELFGEERFRQLYVMCSTSGTTGIPTPYPIFGTAVSRQAEIIGRMAWRVGLRPGDRLAICFGLSMHVAGTPNLLWYLKFPGITLYPIGAEAGSERILKLMKMFKVNAFTGTPSLALHLIERAPAVLGAPVKSLGLKTLLCGAEPGAGIPEVRSRLETEYGAKVFDYGAGIGCSCDCSVYQGMHSYADDYCYYELMDPETKKPVPLSNGATGLAVFTALEPEASLFFFNLRTTTNDIHQVFTDPCPCGLSGFRYKIVGRADDMLKVKGVPVYPAAIQGVINSFVPRLTGAFRILLDEPPPRVVPPLKLKVEYGEEIQERDLDALQREVLEKMHHDVKIRPAITWLKPGSLERARTKTKLIEKSYEKQPKIV
ncbi:MAG: AMP-binding protein [Acidobacteriota bacterium]